MRGSNPDRLHAAGGRTRRRRRALILAGALMFGASPATIAMAQGGPPRLTAISGASGNDCSIALDLRRSVIVAYDTPTGSRFGIDGRVYNFAQRDGRYDSATGAYTYRSSDGKISVRRQPLRTVNGGSVDITISSLTTTVNGRSSVVEGYFSCPPGG